MIEQVDQGAGRQEKPQAERYEPNVHRRIPPMTIVLIAAERTAIGSPLQLKQFPRQEGVKSETCCIKKTLRRCLRIYAKSSAHCRRKRWRCSTDSLLEALQTRAISYARGMPIPRQPPATLGWGRSAAQPRLATAAAAPADVPDRSVARYGRIEPLAAPPNGTLAQEPILSLATSKVRRMQSRPR